jgi:hypothetical protein
VAWLSGSGWIKLGRTPQISDPLPQDLADQLGQVVAALDWTVPPKHLDQV